MIKYNAIDKKNVITDEFEWLLYSNSSHFCPISLLLPEPLLSLPFCSNKLGRVEFSFLFFFDPAGRPAAVRACRQAGQAGKLPLLISVDFSHDFFKCLKFSSSK